MTTLADLKRQIQEENRTHCEIPNSVTSIGLGAFRNCTSLTSITLPSSVTEIGHGAFRSCTSLTSITLPGSVTSIGYAAFAYCTSLTSIITTNPLLTAADAAQKEQWGIPNDCQIISPEVFCQQEPVTKALKPITHDHLTPEQKIFLYMNHHLWEQLNLDELHNNFDPKLKPTIQNSLTQQQTIFLYINRHRWAELTLQELQTHLGEAPLTLLQQIQPPLLERVYNGLSVLTKASVFSQENTSLKPVSFFDALYSSCKIKDAQIALKLINVAKPEQTVQQGVAPAP